MVRYGHRHRTVFYYILTNFENVRETPFFTATHLSILDEQVSPCYAPTKFRPQAKAAIPILRTCVLHTMTFLRL
jgi:hypothetical protein